MSSQKSTERCPLTDSERMSVAEQKATCPFIGTAVVSQDLPIYNTIDEPLALISDVARLGDTGGGDLGSRVLKLFARGNHSRMIGAQDKDAELTPDGMFSLLFGGSQGAHAGHSGILLGDPSQVGQGRFDQAAFDRLVGYADTDGYLSVDEMGDFIAENIRLDPEAKVLPGLEWIKDIISLLKEFKDLLLSNTADEKTEVMEALTKILGDDHLIASAGEWGLLFAFLEQSPKSKNGEIALADVEQLFVHKQFPEGWETWKKRALCWITATLRLTKDAAMAYHMGWK